MNISLERVNNFLEKEYGKPKFRINLIPLRELEFNRNGLTVLFWKSFGKWEFWDTNMRHKILVCDKEVENALENIWASKGEGKSPC